MNDLLDTLARHGSGVLFLSVFAEQIGVPVPSAPIIIAAGALVGTGRMNPAIALADILVASLLADGVWYLLGKRYGGRILGFLCRVSLVPDSCVRDTRDRFARNGPWLILTSKFVPGLNTITPPLAGTVGISISRFFALDSLGILFQAVLLLGAGWVLREPVEWLLNWLGESGARAPLFVGVGLFGYVVWQYSRRRRLLHELRMARITPAALKAKLDAGEPVFIIDMRHPEERSAEQETLPGAFHLAFEEIDARRNELPRDREIVLFCT